MVHLRTLNSAAIDDEAAPVAALRGARLDGLTGYSRAASLGSRGRVGMIAAGVLVAAFFVATAVTRLHERGPLPVELGAKPLILNGIPATDYNTDRTMRGAASNRFDKDANASGCYVWLAQDSDGVVQAKSLVLISETDPYGYNFTDINNVAFLPLEDSNAQLDALCGYYDEQYYGTRSAWSNAVVAVPWIGKHRGQLVCVNSADPGLINDGEVARGYISEIGISFAVDMSQCTGNQTVDHKEGTSYDIFTAGSTRVVDLSPSSAPTLEGG